MHLGSIKTAGYLKINNFKYILLNNNTHDSVGGQKTNTNYVNFKQFSKSMGFKKFYSITNKKKFKKKYYKFFIFKTFF